MKQFICAFSLLLFLAPGAYAEDGVKRGAAFYGGDCQLCGEYGYCSRTPTHREAVNALTSYYVRRGFRVLVIRQKERFLEAEIYRDRNRVDRILLDLRTGRIRSVY